MQFDSIKLCCQGTAVQIKRVLTPNAGLAAQTQVDSQAVEVSWDDPVVRSVKKKNL